MGIVVISFNIHKGKGWKSRQSTISLIQDQIQILNPDIVLLQEIRGNQFELFSQSIWPHVSYGKNAIYPKGHHGNAILTKFPIIEMKNHDLSTNRIEKRGMLHTIVRYHNGQPIHIICVHLGLFKIDRHKQMLMISSYIKTHISPNDAVIVAGDFNDWGELATGFMIQQLGFSEAFLSLHGFYARTFPSWAPFLKLDRIYTRKFNILKSYRILQTPWKSLSDHIALYVDISLESPHEPGL
jgi:endonuclease/exonuclease/phosphatase family metal-dependent hydrolase